MPMLTEALPGYRAWELDSDGGLWPATGSAQPWDTGINVARCGHERPHEAPGPDCSCGLYAFHRMHGQLACESVVGAVAAWGAMEVHRDGFRAGRARILALASSEALLRGGERAALERAAKRYGVPIVSRAALQPFAALQTGLLPVSVLAIEAGEHERWLSARRGYDCDQQLWAEPGGGAVTLGVSVPLRAWLGGEISVAVSDSRRPGGAVLRLAGDAASVELQAGVQGVVRAVNARLGPPDRAAADVDGAGWLMRIEPADWARDCAAFDWGATGRAGMIGIAQRDGAAGFHHLLQHDDLDPVASWRDVGALLRAERESPPARHYAGDRELYDDLGITLGRALAGDERGRRHLERLGLVIALEVSEPAARLVFDLRADRGTLCCGAGGAPAEVVVSLEADDLRPLLAGRIDLARETRTGRIRLSGPRAQALSALSVLTAWSRRNRIGAEPLCAADRILDAC